MRQLLLKQSAINGRRNTSHQQHAALGWRAMHSPSKDESLVVLPLDAFMLFH